MILMLVAHARAAQVLGNLSHYHRFVFFMISAEQKETHWANFCKRHDAPLIITIRISIFEFASTNVSGTRDVDKDDGCSSS